MHGLTQGITMDSAWVILISVLRDFHLRYRYQIVLYIIDMRETFGADRDKIDEWGFGR